MKSVPEDEALRRSSTRAVRVAMIRIRLAMRCTHDALREWRSAR